MPVHMWNFFRAVGVGSDLKVWNEDNPQVTSKTTCCPNHIHLFYILIQVEDDREGGNSEFDDDVSGQYEDEVSAMMRRLRLNFYRAEDMLFIYRKRQWEIEDKEFAIEQKRRAKEKRERMVKRNRDRRLQKEKEEQKLDEDK